MEATTVFAKGRVYWAKILGDPVNNYERTGKEWTLEFEPDDPSFLKEHRLLDRLKDKYDDREPFLTLRKPAENSEGEKNDPIRVMDADNEPWDQTKLIGNGSGVDMKLRIVDWGKGKFKSIWVTAIRVTDHVPYVSNEFAGMDGDAKPSRQKDEDTKPAARTSQRGAKKAPPAPELDDLDDEIPF